MKPRRKSAKSTYDQRKAAYAAALQLWRVAYNSDPLREPRNIFGLDNDEAADVRANGYSFDKLPRHLQPSVAERRVRR